MTDPIVDPGLVLKITPPKLRKSLLVRDRLRRIRASSDDVPFVVVEAPAGHGKTSLLAQWRLDWQQAGAIVGWLSLDTEDTPTSVVSGIVLGLRRSTGNARFGTAAIEAVRRGAGTEPALTSLLAEITEAATPMVLIFDSCERVGNPMVLAVFDYLLHNVPPNLQLVAGSRPPIPLNTIDLLKHGDLRRVTAADLRFDLPETIRLLSARLGDHVDADLCAHLHEITEGWPLGVQLAASALERAADPAKAIQAFSTSRDDATRELLDGMIDALQPRIATFLTRCALLGALHPSLCEAVTGDEDAALLLQRLVVETPLLTATEDGEWLRLHPLAREHLRARAERTVAEAERRELHVRAWHWLAAHGLPEQAVQHALAARCRDEALALIAGSLTEEFNRGNSGTVVEWLSRIPPQEIRDNVTLRLVALWMQTMSYRTARDAVIDAIALADDPTADEWVRGEAVLALANVYGYADDFDSLLKCLSRYSVPAHDSRGRRICANEQAGLAIYTGATEDARQHLTLNPDDGKFPLVRIWGEFFTGLSYLWEGRPVHAEQVVGQKHAFWETRVGRRGQWTSMLGCVLAVACWQRDGREEARALLAHRIDVIEQTTLPEGVAYTYRILAQMAAASGDEARAFAYLEALASMGASRALPRFVVVSLAERVRLHVVGQRPKQAASMLIELTAAVDRQGARPILEPLLRLEHALAQTYVALSSGDARGAGDSLATAWTLAGRINRGYELVQVLALRALLADRAGESPAAMLIEALSRAEAGGLVRAFADAHPDVVDLVRRFASGGSHAPVTRGFIEQVLAAANITGIGAVQPVLPAGSAILTPKEEEVLGRLARGLPNKRIAAELGLSSETVKWHVKKLFTKLNAGSREHAVDRARMLGLLP